MCFRSRRAAATTIRRATTTTTMRTRTTTTTLRGTAAIWLFLLTFMSMQRHRLSGDCCYGAALLMQQQMPQKQQTLQQQQQIQQYHHHHLHHQSSGVFRDQEQDQDEADSRQAINSDASASTSPGSPMSSSTAPSLPPPLPSTATTPSTATPTSAPMRPGPSGPSYEAEGFGGPAAVEWPPEDAGPEGGGGGGADDAVRVARAPPEGSLALQADDPDGRRRLAHDDPIHALSRLLQEQKQARPRPRDWGQEGEAGAGAGAAVEAEGALPGRRHVVREKLQFTPELSLKQGRVVGIVRRMQPQTGLRDVDQFLGLPYAEAPVGSRRFMPPGTPLPWQGLKMARHLPPVCPQKLPDPLGQSMSRGRHKQLTRLLPYLRTESEDCLYLNVYVPRGDGLEQAHLYPVLVYIHGESFEWNSGNPYDGSVLASYGELIVVTVNYRLGVLGFLKPGISENTVANFGLLDQIAALHWIKENIGSFGGDRDRVTLMGHSTGAACVNYLMVSPVASGLFHRAILMSGSAMSDWAAANHSLQLTMQLAHSLDCPLNDDNEEMLDCLRAKRYEDILKISTAFPQFSTSLGPIVDGHVIPNQPYKVMGQYTELFSRYDLLFGVTESESYHTLDARDLEEGLREDERDNLLRFYMQSRFDVRPDLALAATLKKYIDMYNNPIRATNTEHRDVVLDILSDARVVGPLMQTGLFHADVNPHNYMYVFGHNSAAGPHASLPHSIVGEELAFIFGAPLAPAGPFHNSYTKHEKLLSEAVMAYWSNFAKTGNPKAPWKGTFINLHAMEWDRYDLDWPEFNKRTQAYINIGIPPSIGYKYRQVYMNFWNKELPDELNQIAAIQQQPFLLHHQQQPPPASLPGFLGPRGGTAPSLPPPRRGGEVITGHMSQFGSRDNAAEDPVRTLKLLLQEPPYGAQGPASAPPPDTAENMYNAPPTFGQAYAGTTSTARAHERETEAVPGLGPGGGEKEVARSETTLQLLIGLIVVFIVLNVAIYSTFLLQKKRKKQQSATSATAASQMMRKLGAGGILSYDGATDDELKRSKPVGDGDDSFVLDIVRKSNKYEPVAKAAMTMTMTTTTTADRSPIHGFQMQRQLSCSTVDTHTKVCEWMAGGGGLATAPAAPRGARSSQRTATTMSSSSFSSRGGSGSGSRGGGGSSGAGSFLPRPRQVNVAVDATPQARGQSVLGQEPIEGARLAKGGQIIICQEVEVADQELLAPQDSLDSAGYRRQLSAATEPCGGGDEDEFAPPQQLVIAHQHSRSDPVEMPYSRRARARDHEQVTSFIDLNVNVTSRSDDDDDEPGGGGCARTPAEQLSLIKRRNYPKVLPTAGGGARAADSPPMTLDLGSTRYKRNSLPPNGLVQQLLQLGPQPPMPPPRTISTLGRRPSQRRGSAVLTTSPVRLAQDCTVDEEDEEPAPIAQNTLIVGPIVPKADFSTLRRARRPEGVAGETRPPPAHHTEAVYAIEAPGSGSGPAPGASAAAPLTPITPTTPLSPANFSTAPNTPSPGDIYAVPHKGAARLGAPGGRSNIPRILPGTLGQDPATAPSAAASTTALPTTSTSAGHDTTAATAAAASSTPGVSASSSTASRIPQLSRGPNALQQHNHHQQQPQQDQQHSHQQQQQPLGHQQHLQHSPTNQDESGAAADAPGAAGGGAATTTPAAATALSTPLTTTTTTNSAATAATTTTPSASAAAPPTGPSAATCGSSPGVPAVPSSASLDSASSSSTSSACSSSPSSTGTVRTELKQRKK